MPELELKLALFVELYDEELFVDLKKTDLSEIENAISLDISSQKIKYPWVYHKLLYDRSFKNFTNQSHQQAGMCQ